MAHPALEIRLPAWIQQFLDRCPASYPTAEDRMALVLTLARENLSRKTGGPFAAAVFDGESRLVAAGVNLVELGNCSILHAEVVALTLSQLKLRRYDIGAAGRMEYELVTAAEPCLMCLGAVIWSGVSRVVCGARDEDVRSIGFDEGPKPVEWVAELEKRGIEVRRDVRREEAASVLRHYARSGGLIYNPGRPET